MCLKSLLGLRAERETLCYQAFGRSVFPLPSIERLELAVLVLPALAKGKCPAQPTYP